MNCVDDCMSCVSDITERYCLKSYVYNYIRYMTQEPAPADTGYRREAAHPRLFING